MHLRQYEIVKSQPHLCLSLTWTTSPHQTHALQTSKWRCICSILVIKVPHALVRTRDVKTHTEMQAKTVYQAPFHLYRWVLTESNSTYYSWQPSGTSLLFLFSLRCTAVCHNIASFPMKTSKCHTVTSPLAPWPLLASCVRVISNPLIPPSPSQNKRTTGRGQALAT